MTTSGYSYQPMPVKRTPRPSAGAGERVAQKRRTRKAIVDAAMALLAQGKTPSVNDVAAAADVSRRTVYLYFPAFEQLLMDATLGVLSQSPVDAALAKTAGLGDPEASVDTLVRALHHVTPDTERLGRSLIRLTVQTPAAAGGAAAPRRGYRRIDWIESALAPLRPRLGARRWRRLVCAVAMVVGWEALIVQRDICGLNAAEGEALSRWAARSLVREALREPK